jgi:hypothetical protein
MNTKILAALMFALLAAGQSTESAVQAKATSPNSAGLPKPAVPPTPGTWKYKETDVGGPHTLVSTYSLTIKDEGGAWTITTDWKSDLGPVTNVSTLEKGTLVLRKESFTHFLHENQPWKPIAINLDFTGSKATGAMKYVSAPDKSVTMDLEGPIFTYPAGWIGCLPLAEGYSTTFRYFDIDRLPIKPQATTKLVRLKVLGMERVTVSAGTFDSYKIELTSADEHSNKETIWIAKDSRIPVKTSGVDELYGVFNSKMVP